MVEDTQGKGHVSRHPKEEQRLITLPEGLDSPPNPTLGVAVESRLMSDRCRNWALSRTPHQPPPCRLPAGERTLYDGCGDGRS